MNATEPAANGEITAVASEVDVAPQPRSVRRVNVDGIYRWTTLVVSLGLVVIVVTIVAVILSVAWPAIGRLGFGFFTGTVWNHVSEDTGTYGAVPFLAGTAITTGLSLLIALPISLAIAVLLTEYAPAPIAAALGVIVEVAAGVPTIVFGAWALLVLLPWLDKTAEPAIAAVLGWLPLFNPADITGYGLFSAGLVLSAMVFPTIVSVTRNSMLATPPEMREASLGLGATRWETATRVVLRQARAGIFGAVILACGRAIGETMAVIYVIGGAPRMPHSLFDQGYTLSTELLTQVQGAIPGHLFIAALYELGLVLLALSLLTSFIGRVLTQRLSGVAVIGGGR